MDIKYVKMNEKNYDFWLSERIQKIKEVDCLYNLRDNAYISFSGGKDSTIVHYLIDMALPNNNIPRVYCNTGIDYKLVTEFVSDLQKKDSRFQIIKPNKNIKDMLNEKGYPFKSKEHSLFLSVYQNKGMTSKTVRKYLGETVEGKTKLKSFQCPENLKYQFTPDFKLKVSKHCCEELKEKPFRQYEKENKKPVCITGIRTEEGGYRKGIKSCTAFDCKNTSELRMFHPLRIVTEGWENWFIEKYKIELCKLYLPPYNFIRTGCKGCPYNIYIYI